MTKLLNAFLVLVLALGVSVGVFGSTQESTSTDTGVKGDLKEAGHATKRAAKKVGHKTKHTTKKIVHKGAKKTRQGAAKTEEKTETAPQ